MVVGDVGFSTHMSDAPVSHRTVGYGGVLILLIASMVVTMAGSDAAVVVALAGGLRGLTLFVLANHVGVARPLKWLVGVLVVAVVAGGLSRGGSAEEVVQVAGLIDLLLVAAGPVLIVRDVGRHLTITPQTVMAALSIYLLVAMCFALVLGVIAGLGGGPVFAEGEGTSADHLYFSLVTITTLGYGDLTPGADLVRMVAATEALLGQIYLVTIVALVVGRLGEQRRTGPGGE